MYTNWTTKTTKLILTKHVLEKYNLASTKSTHNKKHQEKNGPILTENIFSAEKKRILKCILFQLK